MANTFKSDTKTNVVTDAVSSTNTNVVTCGGSATIVLLSVLVSNTTGASAQVDVFLVTAGDNVHLIRNAPVPAGSSFVISDTGKTVLETADELRVYCDTANALDVSVSILTGVS